jgi:hypothetical protein
MHVRRNRVYSEEEKCSLSEGIMSNVFGTMFNVRRTTFSLCSVYSSVLVEPFLASVLDNF